MRIDDEIWRSDGQVLEVFHRHEDRSHRYHRELYNDSVDGPDRKGQYKVQLSDAKRGRLVRAALVDESTMPQLRAVLEEVWGSGDG